MNIQKLYGNWRAGWALDLHSISSIPLGDGHFDTDRTELGKSLYMFKYQDDISQKTFIIKKLTEFMNIRYVTPHIEVILPVPPSDLSRKYQPVFEIADSLGKQLNIHVDKTYIKKTKKTEELKDIEDIKMRQKILDGIFRVKDNKYKGKKVLLFDDLFRSGSTLKAITKILYKFGEVNNVYVVTLTKTRSKK